MLSATDPDLIADADALCSELAGLICERQRRAAVSRLLREYYRTGGNEARSEMRASLMAATAPEPHPSELRSVDLPAMLAEFHANGGGDAGAAIACGRNA